MGVSHVTDNNHGGRHGVNVRVGCDRTMVTGDAADVGMSGEL